MEELRSGGVKECIAHHSFSEGGEECSHAYLRVEMRSHTFPLGMFLAEQVEECGQTVSSFDACIATNVFYDQARL